MNDRERVLGILLLALGLLGGAGALLTFLVLGGTAGFLELAGHDHPESGFVVWLLAALAFGIGFLNLVFAVPSIVAGVGLLTGKRWAPFLALIASVLNLINMPFGTAVGIVGLWILLPRPATPPPREP